MRIVTHDGTFHTDDVFAVATLLLVVGPAEIIRSRKPEARIGADYVVDVGMEYDSARKLFDHHQPGGAGKRENGIPYAAFGLVWKECGEKLAGGKREAGLIDRKLVQPIDGPDNGVAVADNLFEGIRPFTIGDFLHSYLTRADQGPERFYEIFIQMVDIAKKLLEREIIKAREDIIGEDILSSLYKNTIDKRLIELTDKSLPWGRFLGQLPEPLYVIYQRTDLMWGIQAIPDLNKPYGHSRKPLPKSWGGKEGQELQNITGVGDAVFAHNGLFIAVAVSKEGAMALAQIALNA